MITGQSVESARSLRRSSAAACRFAAAGFCSATRGSGLFSRNGWAICFVLSVRFCMRSSPRRICVGASRHSAGSLVQSTRFPRGVGRSLSVVALEAPSNARDPPVAARIAATDRSRREGFDSLRSCCMALWYSAVVRVRLQNSFGLCSCKQEPIASGSRAQVRSVCSTWVYEG
ncbi:MAG: hypothetical protein RIT24_659 [Planctomycetota bacterium]